MNENKQAVPLDMGLLQNRLDLVSRYNEAVGAPGPQVEQVQREFVDELMPPEFVSAFVDQCEMMIAARSTMQPGMKVVDAQWPYNTGLSDNAG